MFATTVPGLGRLLAAELGSVPGVTVLDTGFDGRTDVVVFEADRQSRRAVWNLGMTEDIFVEVGRTLRSEGDQAPWIARRVWRPERVQRALSTWAEDVGPLRAAMTYRVIVRVLQERSFKRTELRRHLSEAIGADRPRWRVADPARLEVWLVEYRQGRFLAGLRLSSSRMRQHQGRAEERTGALRPAVADAMVRQAGTPGGVLLDPCCGSGTILAEALATGWTARGVDIDSEAVRIARSNVPSADVTTGDVRALALGDGSVAACVSNLPFGRQYTYDGDMKTWLRAALGELARVTRPGGRVVLLAPEIPRQALPAGLRHVRHTRLRLLGTNTTLWVYDRVGEPGHAGPDD